MRKGGRKPLGKNKILLDAGPLFFNFVETKRGNRETGFVASMYGNFGC